MGSNPTGPTTLNSRQLQVLKEVAAFLYLDVTLAESGEIWQNLSKKPVLGQLFEVHVGIATLLARYFRVTLPEMPSKNPHLEDDIPVFRDKIIKMFDPPPGRSTFFEWVNKGTVVKVLGLTGYFLLNATRKKVKLPLLDVKRFVAPRRLYVHVRLIGGG